VRGAVGLGDPEVRAGARGFVRLAGVVPVPARILAVSPGRAWEWRVGLVEMRHAVDPRPDGCEVRLELSAPGPLEVTLGASYGPLIALLLRNLARVAAGESLRD
jgi:hypothetical protein